MKLQKQHRVSPSARVCLSTPEYPPVVGGIGVAAQRLTRTLVAAGYDVHVVTRCDTPGASEDVREAVEDGAAIHRLYHDLHMSEAAFVYRQLVRRLDEAVGFDLFHGFFLTTVYPCVAVAMRGSRPRPVIASIRGNDALTLIDHPYMRRTILAELRQATWITSVSELYLQRAGEEVDLSGRSSVIRNSVARSSETSKPWSLTSENRGVVGTVGQLRRVKDVPLLVRGYAQVPAGLRRRLVLAGYFDDREEEEWSRVLMSELNLTEEVRITGRFSQRDVFHHLRTMHVYVQSSAAEGLPNALLEAAAIGLPLVATAVGGMREVLVDGESGLLVPHGDPAQLAGAIARVLADDSLARRLSAGARKLAEQLSPEQEASQWLALYRRLLASS